MFELIKDKIIGKKVVIFGEIHGTKETPELLSKFFSEMVEDEKFRDFSIGLEIPVEFQEDLTSYMKSGDIVLLRKVSFFSKENCLDGRNSIEYIKLIENIYRINLKNRINAGIFFIDPIAKNQKEKEAGLAENILKILNEKKRIFAILGSIHASKDIVYFKDERIIPAGNILSSKLKDDFFNIGIFPKTGEFFNFEIKKISFKLTEFFSKGFDYIFELDRVTPVSFLD